MDIVIGDDDPGQAGHELRERLYAFNEDVTGFRDGRPLTCFLRDEHGDLIAGLDGFSWGGYARIDVLWVRADHRGRGVGRSLVTEAIAEAQRRRCTTMVLETHTFQAPEFYRACGFVEVGRTIDTPAGHDQVVMQRPL